MRIIEKQISSFELFLLHFFNHTLYTVLLKCCGGGRLKCVSLIKEFIKSLVTLNPQTPWVFIKFSDFLHRCLFKGGGGVGGGGAFINGGGGGGIY